MGYSRIVQYGNITEIYQYERPRIRPQKQNHLKIHRLLCRTSRTEKTRLVKPPTTQKKSIGYFRKDSAIRRTLRDFYRLCHHNVVNSKSVHFVTLTFIHDYTYKECRTFLKLFIQKASKLNQDIPIRYISVPELTKKNRYHFHILMFDLLPQTSGLPISKRGKKIPSFTTERDTRLLQHCFGKGFVDICPTTYSTGGIAGYMAKYMSKSFTENTINASSRNYNCSRNIKKISSYASNTLNPLIPLLKPDVQTIEIKEMVYNDKYLGKCKNTRIKTIINNNEL